MKKVESVLIISDFAFPVSAGTERLVFGLARYLNSKGIKADILTPNWDNLKEKETQENVNIFRFKTHKIKKTNPVKRMYDYFMAGKKLEKYDVYHGFYTLPPVISAIMLAKAEKGKSITTYFSTHQIEKNLSNPVKKSFILGALKKADLITAYTWRIKKIMEEEYFPKKEITVTQGWIESNFKKTKEKKKAKEKIILFTGRLSEQKGAFVLIKAFAKVKEKVKNAKLVFAGMPYQKKEAEEMIKELNLGKSVDILGFISEKKLNHWYNVCDVVAVPGFEDYGIGLSLMEATLFEKPIISCYGLGIENEALIVKPGDDEDLAEKLIKLLLDKEFYEKNRKKAKEISKLFDKEKVMEKYLQAYEKVMNK